MEESVATLCDKMDVANSELQAIIDRIKEQTMDFSKVNEELISIVEKNIDPSFRDYVKKSIDDQRADINKRVDKLNADKEKGWFSKWDQQDLDVLNKVKDSKNLNAGNIYRYIASLGLDVENCTIESVAVEGLTSKKLNKMFKNCGCQMAVVLVPTNVGFEGSYYRNNRDAGRTAKFQVYQYSKYVDGDGKEKVYFEEAGDRKYYDNSWDSVYKMSSPAEQGEKGRVFMANVNDGSLLKRGVETIWFAYGNTRQEKRKEIDRNFNVNSDKYTRHDVSDKHPSDFEAQDPTKSRWAGRRFDKSGYIIDMDAIQKRLAAYKNSKGSYTKEVAEVTDSFEKALNVYKEQMQQWDPRKGSNEAVKELRQVLDNFASDFRYLAQACEKNDANNISYYLKDGRNFEKKVQPILDKIAKGNV